MNDDQGHMRVTAALLAAIALTSLGAPYLIMQVTGMTLLLATHGIEGLVIAYLGATALILPLGWLLNWLEKRFTGASVFMIVLGVRIVAALGLFLAWLLSAESFVGYAVAVWARVELVLGTLAFWSFAARSFGTTADRKPLLWLSVCEAFSLLIAGVAAPQIALAVGVGPLLLFVIVLLLAALPPTYLLGTDQEIPTRPVQAQRRLRDRRALSPSIGTYLAWVALAMTLWTAAHYLLDAIFHGLAAQTFENDLDRLSYFSYVLAASGLIATSLLAIGRSDLVRRFGLNVIITSLPLGLLAMTGLSIGLMHLTGLPVVLVVGLTLMKAIEFAIVSGFYQWAWRSLFTPVPDSHRQAMTDHVYRTVHFGGTIAATAVLFLVLRAEGFSAETLLIGFALIAAAGLIAAVFVTRGYIGALERALTRRQSFKGLDGSATDRQSREVIQRLLRQGDSKDAIEAARMQATLDLDGFLNMAPRLIARGDAEVVRTLLGTVPEVARPELYPPMAGRLTVEEDPKLRDALLIAAAATGHVRSPRLLARALAEAPDAPPLGALIGLARHGGAYGAAVSGQFLERYALTGDVALSRALEATSAIGPSAPSGPVALALRSTDALLRRRAIRAAGKIGDAALAPLLVQQLSDPREWRAATLALSALGAGAIEALAQAIGDRALPVKQRTAAIRALGDIDAPEAREQLWRHAESKDRNLRPFAHLALWRSSAVADREHAQRLLEFSREDMLDAAEITLAANDLAPLESPLLTDLLRQRAQRSTVCAIRAAGLAKERQPALELNLSGLFGLARDWRNAAIGAALLPDDLRPVFTAISDRGSGTAIEALRAFSSHPARDPDDWLGHMLTGAWWATDWTRAVAYYHLVEMMPDEQSRIDEMLEDPGPQLAATMRECKARLASIIEGDEKVALTTVEKVLILKSADLFAQVPDEELAEIAPFLEAIYLDPEETIITEGEIGDELYIIVSGEVKVVKGGTELARLGERMVFGELAALDPEPRSASIIATMPTQVLSLSNEHLLSLFEANVEISSGVIATLIRRLRAST
jgi:HEAT repeat protein